MWGGGGRDKENFSSSIIFSGYKRHFPESRGVAHAPSLPGSHGTAVPARFRRVIHQQAQVSSFETFHSNPESLTIVLLSHLHGIYQTVAGKCSCCPTL